MPKAKPMTKEERTEKLRADVLAVVTDLGERAVMGGALTKAASLAAELKRKGWSGSDFKTRWGSDDLERAIDRALQFHRKAGRIHYEPRFGWKVGK
jgi:hypothetical protein